MWSETEQYTPAQRERMNALLDQTYRNFDNHVSAARKTPENKMSSVAKGRVWTGAQAVKIGLVDELGGYDVALAAVRKALKLDESSMISLETFPMPPSPGQRLLKLFHHLGAESAMMSSS